jgi:hypothetical protein
MNDAQRWERIDLMKRICGFLGMNISASGDLISIMKPATEAERKRGHSHGVYCSFHMVEEAWAFLEGYCAANAKDILEIIPQGER